MLQLDDEPVAYLLTRPRPISPESRHSGRVAPGFAAAAMI